MSASPRACPNSWYSPAAMLPSVPSCEVVSGMIEHSVSVPPPSSGSPSPRVTKKVGMSLGEFSSTSLCQSAPACTKMT